MGGPDGGDGTDLGTRLLAAAEGRRPGDLDTVVAEFLSAEVGATTVTLRVVDYGQTRLRTAGLDGGEVAVDNTASGRAFAAQRTEVVAAADTGPAVHLPLTVRGDRLGVLEVRLPRAVDDAMVRALERHASAVAAALATTLPVTDTYERARRDRPLTLAAEMQWTLLPGESYADPDVAVAGMLEPAYSIAGDAFDWARDADHLAVSVVDGTGRGIPAALATSLAVQALRNARRAGLPLSDQASLADQALYAHYAGTQHVSALLLSLDTVTGRLLLVGAGAPLVLRLRGADVTPLDVDPQLPLGMFEETAYDVQLVQLEPRDRIVVVSDGMSGARVGDGPDFGTADLLRGVRETRQLSAAEVVRQLMRALRGHCEEAALEDDAVVLCLDWTRPDGPDGA